MNEATTFTVTNWFRILIKKVGEELKDKETKRPRDVYVVPMNRADTYLMHAHGIADTVMHIHVTEVGAYLTFQPAIPHEVTQFGTEPPIKTRPLNNDRDMETLAEAIAIFAAKDFLKWQATALLESKKLAQWRGESTAFLESLSKEAWCPEISVAPDASIKATVGEVTVKATADKLTITFFGKTTDYLEVVRGALRDEHRRAEERMQNEDRQEGMHFDAE
jgi:hypothetical protein